MPIMWPKIAIVCGTGRCGTVSFTELLKLQKNVYATHEGLILPWNKDLVAYYQGLLRFILDPDANNARIIANVAFYWKNYLSDIFRDIPDIKVLFLKRDRQKVIDSFSGMYNQRNLWSDPEGENFDGRKSRWPLGEMFPWYDLPKQEAIGRYWDEYYRDADFWLNKFPENTMLVNTADALGNPKTQRKALKFLGINRPVINTEIKTNTTAGKPFVFDLDKPVDVDSVRKKARENQMLGQAGVAAGVERGVGVQLTDKEWDCLMEAPGIEKLLERTDGNLDNGQGKGREDNNGL